jgi:hypothetical protein
MDDLICGVCGQDEGEHAHVPLYEDTLRDGPLVTGVYTDPDTFEVCVERWLAQERPKTAVGVLLEQYLDEAARWIMAACGDHPTLMPPAWVARMVDAAPAPRDAPGRATGEGTG